MSFLSMIGRAARRARRFQVAGVRRTVAGLALLLETELRLRAQGFARLREDFRPSHDVADAREALADQLVESRRMACAIRGAARLVPWARCLHQSLALLLWLRRRGIAAELRIGVRRPEAATGDHTCDGAPIEAHAWVEWRGIPLNEDPAVCAAFAHLEIGPPAASWKA